MRESKKKHFRETPSVDEPNGPRDLDLELALDEHETAELRRIDAALQRAALGTYGRCIACGTTIPEARLRATPDAERCIDCQSALEDA